MGARSRPDARGPEGRARPRRVARASSLAVGALCRRPPVPISAGRNRSERLRRFTRADLASFHARFLARRPARRSSSPAMSTLKSGGRAGTTADVLDRIRRPAVAGPTRPPSRTRAAALILLDRPGAPQAVVRAGHLGLARSDPDFEHDAGPEPDPGRSVHLAAQRQAARGARLHLRRAQLTSIAGGSRARFRSARPSRPTGSPRRSTRSTTSWRPWSASRPPVRSSSTMPAGALIEGQARHFETPSALVNRFASLVIHGLPVDHDAGFADRLAAIDLDSLIATASRADSP